MRRDIYVAGVLTRPRTRQPIGIELPRVLVTLMGGVGPVIRYGTVVINSVVINNIPWHFSR